MLTAARRREFQFLVVSDFDRFARSLVKGLVLEEQLKKYGVRVVYQRVPVEDTPEGRLLKNQLFSFAEYEPEKFALRSMMGRLQKARTGMVVGGGEPPCRGPLEIDPCLLRGMLIRGYCRGTLQTVLNSGIRYYRCGCHLPHQAKRYGRPVCDLPDVHGHDVEEEL